MVPTSDFQSTDLSKSRLLKYALFRWLIPPQESSKEESDGIIKAAKAKKVKKVKNSSKICEKCEAFKLDLAFIKAAIPIKGWKTGDWKIEPNLEETTNVT